MKTDSIAMTQEFPVSSTTIYNAWLDAEGHSGMTGGVAETSNELNANFTAWDGYISGKNIELSSPNKIVQSWRTTEFEEGAEDSILEILLEDLESGGCLLTLNQSKIPEGDREKYKMGWEDHYFNPMLEYFSN